MLDFSKRFILFVKSEFKQINDNEYEKSQKSMKQILFDSAIVGAITFFSTWNAQLTLPHLLTCLKATGLAFFMQIAFEKGIKMAKTNN